MPSLPLIVDAFGFDPGLNHGAIVQSRFEFTEETIKTPRLIQWEVVFEWTKKDDYSLVSHSDPYQIARLNNAIFASLKGRPIATWGIDYEETAGYWGTAQQDGVLKFFMGYLYRGLQQIGCPVIWLSPSKVRGKLAVPRTPKGKGRSGRSAPKEAVWAAVAGVVQGMFAWENMEDDPQGDVRDAFVLSFLAAQGTAIMALAQQQMNKG